MKLKVVKSRLQAYWRTWWRLTLLQFQQRVANARLAAIFFLLGKLFRFGFALTFVYVVVSRAKILAGYNLAQAIFILALFNFVSTLTQLFLRGVYQFRSKVSDGSFDFYLLSPLNELFLSLFSYTDPLDLFLVLPYGSIVLWAWKLTGFPLSLQGFFFLFASIAIMAIFVFAFHVVIISLGIKYLEVDNTIMLYRDLEKLAAYPIEIYGRVGQVLLTYLLPFALMATLPARFIFGLSSPWILPFLFFLSLIFLRLALAFWHHSLQNYSSASS